MNNEDQLLHLHSCMSNFVVCSLDSIIITIPPIENQFIETFHSD